ncbi:hypothetical protein RclHR1_00150017 [Rhizophagus clarus]|uniref:Uncharacterized protein n=1 Tax=Rhizophagus clarus TaxID=94130 RepID=A0A2Z6QUQ7_9GLOM|nr:hypothetical protein RclHR1_00150017 [Rhizophagus clarus]GET02298.1 hypothetical protein GLOIN_2v1771618 [Rhizophagus clarus]
MTNRTKTTSCSKRSQSKSKSPKKQKTSCSKRERKSKSSTKRDQNCYISFSNLYRRLFNADIRETGMVWNSLPDNIKNEFTKFANRRRILKDFKGIHDAHDVGINGNSSKPIEESQLCIIVDDSTMKRDIMSNAASSDDAEYNKIFNTYVNYE